MSLEEGREAHHGLDSVFMFVANLRLLKNILFLNEAERLRKEMWKVHRITVGVLLGCPGIKEQAQWPTHKHWKETVRAKQGALADTECHPLCILPEWSPTWPQGTVPFTICHSLLVSSRPPRRQGWKTSRKCGSLWHLCDSLHSLPGSPLLRTLHTLRSSTLTCSSPNGSADSARGIFPIPSHDWTPTSASHKRAVLRFKEKESIWQQLVSRLFVTVSAQSWCLMSVPPSSLVAHPTLSIADLVYTHLIYDVPQQNTFPSGECFHLPLTGSFIIVSGLKSLPEALPSIPCSPSHSARSPAAP